MGVETRVLTRIRKDLRLGTPKALRLRTPKAFASRQTASTTRSMIKGRPPRLSQIFQSYDAPLFLVTVCTLHRRKIPSLKAAQEALVVYGTRAISESMSRSADMLLCLT